ncbi:MAG: RNA polymerase subunit sigma-70 [Acidobacteria bacterium]|nr:RNA polymerase subunit sigma-70 [Acidobacteriota bacterium]
MLLAWQQGDAGALRRLIPLVYQELRRVARARLRTEPPGHIPQTTVLVHEGYLRLVHVDRMNVRDRAHLLALAARLMRQILVDPARRRRSLKRGGDATLVSPSDAIPAQVPGVDVPRSTRLSARSCLLDPRLSRVVELKFFAGFTVSEAAEALGVSTATVERDRIVRPGMALRTIVAGAESATHSD